VCARVEAERSAWPARDSVAFADRVLRLLTENSRFIAPPGAVLRSARVMAALASVSSRLWAAEDRGAGVLARIRATGVGGALVDEPQTEDERICAALRAAARGYQGAGGLASMPTIPLELGEGLQAVARLLGEVPRADKGASLGVEDGYLNRHADGQVCWWDPPTGALNGIGRPAARWEQPIDQRDRVTDAERERMDRRRNLKEDRCRRSRLLSADAARPPDDPGAMWASQSTLDEGLGALRASLEGCWASAGRTRT